MLKNQMLVSLIKFLRISNIFDVVNNVYELKSNIKPLIKYKMKTSVITDPNSIVRKFEYINGQKWTYSDLFNNIDNIDGVSIDQEGKFAWIIDHKHGLEIFKENIHYVKIIPENIDFLIQKLQNNGITFDVL